MQSLVRRAHSQLERSAMAKIQAISDTFELRDFIDVAPVKGE